jgi:RNA polymerase-binding transcription factor DksA
MRKKRNLSQATEQAYKEMNNPLMLFLLHTSVHMAEAASYGRENDMTLEESEAKTRELMAKIREEFDKIDQHLNSIEMSNDQIEANLEYAETILTGKKRVTH